MTVALVPHDLGVRVLVAVEGLHPVRYTPGEPLPRTDAEVIIPQFLAGQDATAILGELPQLRLIQLLTAGAEHWIGTVPDGVLLSDCRGAHGGATAEWVLAVLLATYRDVPAFTRAQDQKHWDYHQTEELAGKRVLIVGAGDVGQQTARRLAAFDVTTTMVGRRDGHAILTLLPKHDAAVIAVPLTPETERLVDKHFLAAMPEGAVLVNAARGKVVDTEALVAELLTGRLRVALDVTDPEPLPEDHPLWTCPGLLLTPHVGASVPGGLARAYAVVAEQLAAFLRGEDPPNLVLDGY